MLDVRITPEEVLKKLKNLKITKSAGPDNLHPAMLKSLADFLSHPLCELFNRTLETSQLPEDWKKAIITPIPKKGSKGDVTNFRPISLTSIICKIMESIIRDKICEHLRAKQFALSQAAWFSQR